MANRIANVEPPAIPVTPRDYVYRVMSQKDNVLRLYFKRVTGLFANLLDQETGGRYFYYATGNYYHAADQLTAVVNTVYASSFDTEGENSDMGIASDSQISFSHGGIYLVSARLQANTSSSTTDTITAWLRKNGTTDLSETVVRKTVAGQTGVELTANVNMEIGDYFEVVWAASSTDIFLDSRTASSPYPAIPSASVTAAFVSNN